MTRELVVENLLDTYGKYGVTEKDIDCNIESGIETGLNMTAIYIGLDMIFARLFGVERYYSPIDLAEAFECSVEEIMAGAEDAIREAQSRGVDTSDYILDVSQADTEFLN